MENALIIPLSAGKGEVFRLSGLYQGNSFEKSTLFPSKAPEEPAIPGIEYCVLVVDKCAQLLERESDSTELFIDALVQFEGRADSVQCPFGWVRIEKIFSLERVTP